MKSHFLALIISAIFFGFVTEVSHASTYDIVKNANSEYVAEFNFLVKLKDGYSSGDLSTAVSGLGATIIHTYDHNDWYLVQFTSGNVDDNYDDLVNLDESDLATYDWLITPNQYTPTEALFEDEWPLTSTSGVPLNTNAHEAWSITRGLFDIGVLVLDSGWPDDNHNDWDDTAMQGKYPATDHAGNIIQFASATYGTPYVGNDDELGHATAMGGIISAEHNDEALCGIAPETYTVSANFLFRGQIGCERPMGLTSDALAALEWLLEWNDDPSFAVRFADNLDRIRVVNASWSYYRISDDADALFELISSQLNADDILFVASGGHHGLHQTDLLYFPARWADDADNILAVNGHEQNGDFCTWTNRSITGGNEPRYLIGGPSGNTQRYGQAEGWNCYGSPFEFDDSDILVDWYGEMSNYWDDINNPAGDAGYMGGTSVAAAHVSGVGALVLAQDPTLTAAEVRDILVESAVPGDPENGAGRVNALRALLRTPGNKTLEYDLHIPIDCYLVDNLVVPSGITLTLEPGVDMSFATNAQIQVQSGGKVKIQGTSVNPISMHGDGGAAWKGIASNGGQVTLEWVNMSDVGSAHPSVFAQNSVQLGETYPVYIANCDFEDRGVFIWGSPSLTTRMVNTTIHDVSVDAGLYLYNCNILFDNVSVHDCGYVNSYLKTITGTFYECSFEGQVSNYAVLCNVPTCSPNFYCCELTDMAPTAGSFQTTFFSATGCSPRIGGGILHCVIEDNSDFLVVIEGTGALPSISSTSNDFIQNNGSGQFMEWRSYPGTPTAYNVSGQYWSPTVALAEFSPANASYWNYSGAAGSANGICGSSMSAPAPGGHLALDDAVVDSLEAALDLEAEGEYQAAQDMFVALATNAENNSLKLQALSHVVTTQLHLETESSWIPEMLDEFIEGEESSYDAVVNATRIKAVYYLQQGDYTTAISLCNDLLSSELTEQDEIYVSIDLLSIQMSAGIVDAGGTLDGTLSANVPEELRVTSLAQGLSKEDELLRSLGAEGDAEPTNSPTVPGQFTLHQNYPNPFNPSTHIAFDLTEGAQVTLKVFNTMGQELATVVDRAMDAGHHTVMWDGKTTLGHDVATGVYVYQMKVGEFTDAKKMVLIR